MSEMEYINMINSKVKDDKYLLEVLSNSENDETYIPQFDFEYKIIDCQTMFDNQKNMWHEMFNSDQPIVLLNTSQLFNFWQDKRMVKDSFTDGREMFAYVLSQVFMNDIIKDNKKLIFITNEIDGDIFVDSFNSQLPSNMSVSHININQKHKQLYKTCKN